jgi:hypothetical protein
MVSGLDILAELLAVWRPGLVASDANNSEDDDDNNS